MALDARTIDAEQSTYFNLLAEMGHTKHIGYGIYGGRKQ